MVLSSFAQGLRTPLLAIFIGVCVWTFVAYLKELRTRRPGRLLVVGGSLLFCFTVDFVQAGSPNLGAMIVVAVATAIWAIGLRVDDLRVFGKVLALLAVGSLVLALWWPTAWQREDEKGFFGEEVLAGPFSQMNVFGMALALLLPFGFLLGTARLRVIVILAASAALVLAASRTSLIAAGTALVVMLLLRLQRSVFMRKLTLGLAGLTLLVVVVALPLTTTDRSAFTGRGGIWLNALDFIEGSWHIGHGLLAFAYGGPLFQITHVQASHAHNLFLQYLVMVGLPGLVVLAIFLGAALRSSGRFLGRTVVPAGLFISVLAMGIAEVPIRVEVFDGAAWIAWPLFLSLIFVTDDVEEGGAEDDALTLRACDARLSSPGFERSRVRA